MHFVAPSGVRGRGYRGAGDYGRKPNCVAGCVTTRSRQTRATKVFTHVFITETVTTAKKAESVGTTTMMMPRARCEVDPQPVSTTTYYLRRMLTSLCRTFCRLRNHSARASRSATFSSAIARAVSASTSRRRRACSTAARAAAPRAAAAAFFAPCSASRALASNGKERAQRDRSRFLPQRGLSGYVNKLTVTCFCDTVN